MHFDAWREIRTIYTYFIPNDQCVKPACAVAVVKPFISARLPNESPIGVKVASET